jgi:hypothetical protein
LKGKKKKGLGTLKKTIKGFFMKHEKVGEVGLPRDLQSLTLARHDLPRMQTKPMSDV